MGGGNSKPSKKELERRQQEEEEAKKRMAGAAGRKRGSVSAQGGMDPSKMQVNLNTLPKHMKSEEAVEQIRQCVKNNVLCSQLNKDYTEAVIAAMKEVKVAKGEFVIKQGELGDTWYVVGSGGFEAYKKTSDSEDGNGDLVKSYIPGGSFGELALMYNQRRAASVIAAQDSVAYAVDQATFQVLILTASMQNKESYK